MAAGLALRIRAGVAASLALAALTLATARAEAAGPPVIGETWSSTVFSTSARLNAVVDPNGFATSYRFDYISASAYEANLAAGKDGFDGALRVPPQLEVNIGAGAPALASQQAAGLSPGTAYRYRVVATNSSPATTSGPARLVVTHLPAGGPVLPDGRGWEMVSPVDKNGGQVAAPGGLFGGAALQAAADGQSVTFSSASSFAGGGLGSGIASQYRAVRGGSGWLTTNITAPSLAGAFGTAQEGVPYRIFSPDLARALLLSDTHCRGDAAGCPVPSPPLTGTDAPAGYQNYYLRQTATGGFEALVGADDVAGLDLDPADFSVTLAGATPDLGHVALSTCAALTPAATEVPLGDGCDPEWPNLYLWSAGAGLRLINSTPGAALAAPAGAIAASGQRVYWRDLGGGDLYLTEGDAIEQVDASVGGGGHFETASVDGARALYSKGGHLYRFQALSGSSVDLTPAGGVEGVLGASADAEQVYFLADTGVLLTDGVETVAVASGADADNVPPASGAARVSASGDTLLFLSSERLTGYDNTDLLTGQPDSQVFLYQAKDDSLICVSCNPTNARPIGPSTVPGAIANGTGPGATQAYKPRSLSVNGRRVLFESRDALVLSDTNSAPDVYQWQAQGEGSCSRPGGCIDLISDGRAQGGATFVDASSSGDDAFFLTAGSLVTSDPGAVDLYDARVGGGFPEPPPPIPCVGDSCQALPPEPVDPTLTTLLSGPGNPPVRYQKPKKQAKKKQHAQRRRCRGNVKQRRKCRKAIAKHRAAARKRRGA